MESDYILKQIADTLKTISEEDTVYNGLEEMNLNLANINATLKDIKISLNEINKNGK